MMLPPLHHSTLLCVGIIVPPNPPIYRVGIGWEEKPGVGWKRPLAKLRVTVKKSF